MKQEKTMKNNRRKIAVLIVLLVLVWVATYIVSGRQDGTFAAVLVWAAGGILGGILFLMLGKNVNGETARKIINFIGYWNIGAAVIGTAVMGAALILFFNKNL